MERDSKKFYEDNKPLIEISGLLLVITGIFLNVPYDETLLKDSLSILKFFLLSGSAIAISILLITGLKFYLHKLIDIAADLLDDKLFSFEHKIKIGAAVIAFAGLMFMISFLFILSLVTYITESFPKESIFLLLTLVSYIIFLLISITHKKVGIHILGSSILFFVLFVPFILYLVLYFNVEVSSLFFLGLILVFMFLSILFYLYLNKQRSLQK